MTDDALDLGVVEAVDDDLSLRPNKRKCVLTEPVVPRSGRWKSHHPKSTMNKRIPPPRIMPIRFIILYLPKVNVHPTLEPLGG